MANLSGQLGNMVRAAIEDHDQVFLACAVSLGIDCGATAATFVAAKSLSPALQATGKLLRPPLESNHLLLQLVHEVKWQALLDILAEIDRDPTPYSAKTPPLANLVDTADELSRQKIARRVDARDAARPGEPSRLEKCVTWLLTSISAKSPEIAAFSDSDRLLVQQLDAFLSREVQNQPGALDAKAIQSDLFQLTSSIAADTLLLELDARVAGKKPAPFRQRVAEGPATESQKALAHFLTRFDDPATGWIATYRYRLKQRLSDPQHADEFQRILLNFTSEGLLQGREILTHSRLLQGLVEGLSADFHKRFDNLSAHLASILKALEASRLQLDPLGADKHSQSGDRFIDYVYSKQNTEFVGRGGEMEQLRAFLGADAPILWWQVSGDGGQGKSRIALELIQEAKSNGWHAGFLKSSSMHDIPWTTLPIDRSTLCVVDYVGAPEKAKAVATGLVTLLKRQSEAHTDWDTPLLKPFRLLIVERSPYATEGEAPPAMWYATFCATGDNTGISGAMHAPLPLHLTPLSEEAMRQVIISWRKYRGKAEPAPEDLNRIIAALNKTALDSTRRRAWRPLLAMLIADAILDGTSGRDTTIGNALSFLLEDEQARSWSKIFPPDGFPTRPAARQAILATMLGQLDIQNADLEEAFYQPDDLETRKRAWTTLGYVVDPAATYAGRQAPLLARVPDLLGEYMVDWLAPNDKECERLCTDAWRLDAQSTFAFLVRLAEDRIDLGISKTFRRLASIIPKDMPSETARKINLNAPAYFGLPGLAIKLLELGADPEADLGNGAFPLLFAAQEGHTDVVTALLANGADPNKENDKDGNFPLLMAAQEGHGDIVAALLTNGADPNKIDQKDGIFPLLMAAQNGHGNIVAALLANGADPNKENQSTGSFPLLMASQEGHGNIVAALLTNSADPNKMDQKDGSFPLQMAAQNGHEDIVAALLAKGADPNRENKSTGNFPLLIASQKGYGNIVAALLAKGADPNRENKSTGNFPLLIASQKGHRDIVAALLTKGAAPNKEHEKDGAFPLLMASQEGHESIVQALLAKGADPNKIDQKDGVFPLLMAAQEGHEDIVATLLANGAYPNRENKSTGTFPLLIASQKGHRDIVAALLANGADPNKENQSTGNFPLLIASQKGHRDIVTALLASGADPNKIDQKDGVFPLLMAAQQGHVDVVAALLANGADPNKSHEKDGTFPLLTAATSGYEDIIAALLAKGAAPNKEYENNDFFPLIAAAGKGHVNCVTRLIAGGADIHRIWKKVGLNSLETCLGMFAEEDEDDPDHKHAFWRGAKALLEAGATRQDGTIPDLPPEPAQTG